MVTTRVVRWVAILALVGGGFVGQAVPQDTRPAADNVAEWLRARGIAPDLSYLERVIGQDNCYQGHGAGV